MTVAEVYKVAPAPPQAPKANPRFCTRWCRGCGCRRRRYLRQRLRFHHRPSGRGRLGTVALAGKNVGSSPCWPASALWRSDDPKAWLLGEHATASGFANRVSGFGLHQLKLSHFLRGKRTEMLEDCCFASGGCVGHVLDAAQAHAGHTSQAM